MGKYNNPEEVTTEMRSVRRFLFGLSYLPAALFAIIVVSYIIKTWLVFNDEKVGFELATVSALLGGFILTGAFIDRQNADNQTRLRRIGVVYLISTIAFVVFGLSVPIRYSTSCHGDTKSLA